MGEGTLDLSELAHRCRPTTTVRATVGLGHLVVLVPEDQDLVGEHRGRAPASRRVRRAAERRRLRDPRRRYPGDGGTLILDLEVGMGQIEVRTRPTTDATSPSTSRSTSSPDPTTPSTLG